MRAAIIAEARTWIGTPYAHGASVRGIGCDCLGLVTGVWRALLGPLPEGIPPYAHDWAEATGDERMAQAAARHLIALPPGDAEPGDVLLFRWRLGRPASHAAIAIGPDSMVHAHDGAAVAEVAIIPAWRRRLAYRFAFPRA